MKFCARGTSLLEFLIGTSIGSLVLLLMVSALQSWLTIWSTLTEIRALDETQAAIEEMIQDGIQREASLNPIQQVFVVDARQYQNLARQFTGQQPDIHPESSAVIILQTEPRPLQLCHSVPTCSTLTICDADPSLLNQEAPPLLAASIDGIMLLKSRRAARSGRRLTFSHLQRVDAFSELTPEAFSGDCPTQNAVIFSVSDLTSLFLDPNGALRRSSFLSGANQPLVRLQAPLQISSFIATQYPDRYDLAFEITRGGGAHLIRRTGTFPRAGTATNFRDITS